MINKYSDIFLDLFKYVARSRVSVAGTVISGLIFPVLLVSIFLDMQGIVNNPYFGFLIYMVMGPLFVAGVVTAIVGLVLFKDREEIGLFTLEYIREQMNMPGRFIRVRKMIYLSVFLFVATILVIGAVSYTGFSYTESVGFCGQFCHTVMEPEYITYQNSPHSRVLCVDCHISSEAGLFTRSKVSGIRLIFATVLDRFQRPIETPISSLRPNREVCEQCHRPEMFHGNKLYVKDYFLEDELSTHVQTVLMMRIGSGGYRDQTAQGIHWHVSPAHHTYYKTYPGNPDSISSIKLIDHDGSVFIFDRNGVGSTGVDAENDYRLMDCLDCHNRPTHVFLSADEAIDRKLASGMIPRTLPFIKRQALKVVLQDYINKDQASRGIASALEQWYKDNYPEVFASRRVDLDKAVGGTIQAWMENVFPEMNIGWGTYLNNIGHSEGKGCFRCHDEKHQTSTGRNISGECNLCHFILAEKEADPDILRILHGEGARQNR